MVLNLLHFMQIGQVLMEKKHCYCIYTDRKISTISCNRNTILCLTTLSHALDKAVILHQQSEFTHQFMPRLGGSMSRPHD